MKADQIRESLVTALSRRRFLRGEFSAEPGVLRPPWALAEPAFAGRCTRCDACVAACPTAILVAGSGGFPVVDFARGECTFCGDCVRACEPGALDMAQPQPWQLALRIDAGCLAAANIVCRSCGDSCQSAAIRFRPQVGMAAQPQVDPAACNGCGACVRACPQGAVALFARSDAAIAA